MVLFDPRGGGCGSTQGSESGYPVGIDPRDSQPREENLIVSAGFFATVLATTITMATSRLCGRYSIGL